MQETLRRNDLGIKKIMKQERGNVAEKFFINGWGQIIGGILALSKYQISSDFNNVIDQNIDIAIEKGNKKSIHS